MKLKKQNSIMSAKGQGGTGQTLADMSAKNVFFCGAP